MCRDIFLQKIWMQMINCISRRRYRELLRERSESRSENAVGTAPNNYCIYLDITHSDNTKTYAVMVPFKTGTNDWTKAEKTYTPKKSVKEVKYYLLFRKMTGKAEFRNAVLKQTEQ